MQERDIMGGFELIFPLPDVDENQEKIKLYEKFLASAQDQFEFFNSNKRKNGTLDPTQHYDKGYRRNEKGDNKRPAWGQGNKDSNTSNSERVSKYKSKINV